jgi:anthranilate synthase component 1
MMRFYPDADHFNAASGKPRLVWSRMVLDLETPVSAMLKLMQPDEPCFLLESVEGGASRGRYSIIGLKPDLIWRCNGNRAEVSKTAPFSEDSFEPAWDDSLSSLKKLAREMAMDIPEGLPPMAAGIIGYMGYPTVGLTEKLPDNNPDPIGIPDGMFMRPTSVLIFDSVDGVVYIISLIWPDSARSYDEVTKEISSTVRLLQGPLDQRHQHRAAEPKPLPFEPAMSKDDYFGMVEKAKEYILAGDIFQVVPSQRFSAPFAHHPFALYRSLRQLNPSPFLFYLHFGGFTLVGSSPEILVRVRDETVTIRPIAGTRPRGKTTAEDLALEAELLADAKECAEHLMLLDLGRNDVGRVCVKDSVKVTEQMIIERYSHVMHIVSNVEGKLDRSRYDAVDALFAGFPAGTVSGAPKIRAMEIIDEIEPLRRSFYAGGTGYIGANGSLDICINLRTALVKDGVVYAQAGGGVVADSVPEAEYQESVNKAKAVMKAAENASQFAGGDA